MIISDPTDPTAPPTTAPTPTPVTDAHEATMPKWQRSGVYLLDHLRNWWEIYLLLPATLYGVLFFREWVSRIDPNSGLDGLGSLTGYAMLGVQFALSASAAFIVKRSYFGFYKPRRLRELQAAVALGDLSAWRLLWIDRLEWLPCLLFGWAIFSSTGG